mmetsp:Transcript_26716/g.34033  ORF Transcript_26716/g.34033 Transcript_26716/m.34033 type:complete len:80 (-) Transcript_26716:846-1085(-)
MNNISVILWMQRSYFGCHGFPAAIAILDVLPLSSSSLVKSNNNVSSSSISSQQQQSIFIQPPNIVDKSKIRKQPKKTIT